MGVVLLVGASVCKATPASLQILTNPTIGGNNIVGKVFLDAPAPTGGEVVTLTPDVAIPDLPASVTVAAGATYKAFSFTPNGVDSFVTFAIHAASGGKTISQDLTVNAASLTTFSFSPNSIVGGNNTSGVVTLNGAAGPSGTVISLMNGSSKVVLPAAVTVPYNARTKAFTVVTGGVATITPITNFAHQGSQPTINGTLTLEPAKILQLQLIQPRIVGGNNEMFSIRLDGVAPAGGTVVNITSSNPDANAPTSVTVPAGKYQMAFSFNPAGVDVEESALITGTTGSASQEATL
ncbi:MAG: hypothetical protein ABUL72_04350, partial [Armatimonadota bacterium]